MYTVTLNKIKERLRVTTLCTSDSNLRYTVIRGIYLFPDLLSLLDPSSKPKGVQWSYCTVHDTTSLCLTRFSHGFEPLFRSEFLTPPKVLLEGPIPL